MAYTTSADGTLIAYYTVGKGEPIVIVGGAFSTAEAATPLAEALAGAGLQGVTLDRRARGSSGNTDPYAPQREAEDLAAVIEAVGGEASVLGHSSGAMLALFAAAQGVPVKHLFLSEPPFLFGEGDPGDDFPERLQALVDEGNPDEVVTTFQREAIRLPDEAVDQIRHSPVFPSLVAVAQSVVYDATLSREVSTPTTSMTSIDVPVTILRGEPTFPMLVRAVELLHEAMPNSELVVVPESHDHSIDPTGTAREIRSRLAA